jgi:hypothetical protein
MVGIHIFKCHCLFKSYDLLLNLYLQTEARSFFLTQKLKYINETVDSLIPKIKEMDDTTFSINEKLMTKMYRIRNGMDKLEIKVSMNLSLDVTFYV